MRTLLCHRLTVLSLAGCLGATTALAQPAETGAAQEVDRIRRELNRAYTAGDAPALARLLTQDAIQIPPGSAPVVGREAIRDRYAAQFKQARSTFSLDRRELVIEGSLAFLRGGYERVDRPVGGGETKRLSGEYLMVLTRQPEGWRISRDIWTVRSTEPLEVSIDIPLKAFKSLVEERLGADLDLLRVAAASPEAQSGSWERVEPLLKEVGEARPDAVAIWFARPDGSYRTLKGPAAQSLRDRPYFPDLLAGKSVEGALVISRSTGERTVIVAEPVRRGKQVIGALGMSVSVVQLSRELEGELGLPKDMILYALDEEGKTALHRDPKLMFEYPSDLGGPTLQTAVREMLEKESGEVRYELRGVPRVVHYVRSESLGWVFALGMSVPTAASGVGGAGPR